MNLHDSKKELGTRVDRHDSVGKGTMGMELYHLVMNDPHLDNIPIILEKKDRQLAGPTAAPNGLYLKEIRYEE